MSDQSSPPKPKPGSLRDRIAAFENKGSSSPQQGPPIPRPKPGGLQWKPRAPSPPSPDHPQSGERKQASTGSMSTSDAIESIGRGGSLKERMAALQGKGAFGGPPPVAPKPNVDRQKWKPPPQAPSNNDELITAVDAGARDASRSPPPRAIVSPSHEHQETLNPEGDPLPQDGDGEPGPEEEERQRRAAIAARMARLGGARLGMAPPIFAPKPVVRKSEPAPLAPEVKDEPPVDQPKESSQALATPPPRDLSATVYPEPEPVAETEHRDEHELHPTVNARAPSSMPVPAGPRRAAPPRKKAPKNTLPEPPVEEAEGVTAHPPAIVDEPVPADPGDHDIPLSTRGTQEIAEAAEIVHTTGDERLNVPVNTEQVTTQPPASIEVFDEHVEEPEELVVEESTYAAADDHQVSSERPLEVTEEEEEDEEARRHRVAARLAQMGAFNPLAGPPPVAQRLSIDESAVEEPLNVEDKVNVDAEAYGETIPTGLSRLDMAPPIKHDAAEPHPETDQDNGKLDEDAQVPAHRDGGRAVASYTDEQADVHDGRTWRSEERSIEHVADVVTEQAQSTGFEGSGTSPLSYGRRQGDEDDVGANETKDVVEENEIPAPRMVTRPLVPPPPPVNLRSKPTPPSSPPLSPPPKAPFQALKVDAEEPPASPDMPPRPIPPPGRSGSLTEDVPSPPRRSMPPPPRRTGSVRVTDVSGEAPSSPPPVPTASRPVNRRPDTPPIITTLVQAPTTEGGHVEEPEDVTAQPEGQEDEASARRRAIAERMARLGGIRFGGPPPMNPLSRPPLPAAPPPTSVPPDELEEEGAEEGEDEASRKRRIADKLAVMGGVPLGMLPAALTRKHTGKQEESEGEDSVPPVPIPAPPQRPPPTRKPPPPIDAPAEQASESRRTSDDGVRVEAEESELEEIRYSDAEAPLSEEEDARARRVEASSTPRVTSRSPPPSRPLIPATLLGRRPSAATTRSVSSSRQASLDELSPAETPTLTGRPHSDYVLVEAEYPDDDDAPSSQPSRRTSTRGGRSIALPPVPPPSAIDPPEALSSSVQWELPVIPQGVDESEMASSGWSEGSTAVHIPAVSSQPSSRRASAKGVISGSASGSMSVSMSGSGSGSGSGLVARRSTDSQQPERHMSTDELGAVSARVGAQVVEAATVLLEKSKRELVGDGSYAGFVRAVLTQVPGVAPPGAHEQDGWGYMVYVQTGNAVQRRVSDILPGDVISIWDAKLKGHKGLQPYTQTVGGEGVPLVGIVSAFDGKKSKVRVWQANQHVGQQTVENVSYRLEDLKSGLVKVYRVLDA